MKNMIRPMKIMGKQARNAIDNFMKAFPDYYVEQIVADLQVKFRRIEGNLQIKMKKTASKKEA